MVGPGLSSHCFVAIVSLAPQHHSDIKVDCIGQASADCVWSQCEHRGSRRARRPLAYWRAGIVPGQLPTARKHSSKKYQKIGGRSRNKGGSPMSVSELRTAAAPKKIPTAAE